MGYARYVGRLVALAVALGMGVAVATIPGVAWADDTASASSGGTTGTAGATGTSGPAESEGIPTTGTTPEPTGTSTATGTEKDVAAAPGAGSVDASESGASASTGASVRQVPPGTVNATGGEHSSKESSEGVSPKGDVAAELTTDETPPPTGVADSAGDAEATAPVTTPGGPRGGSAKRQGPVDAPTGVPRVDANILTGSWNAVASRPDISQPQGTVVDVAVHPPVAPQASPPLPQTISVRAQAISAAPEEPTPPRSEVMSGIVLAVLATGGLGPPAPNDPLTPVDSPLELALMAVGTRARQFGQAVDEETGSRLVTPTLTSQAIDIVATTDQQTVTAAPSASTPVKAAPQPTKPDTKSPTVSLTAPASGATVSGTVTLSATATDNVGVAGVQFLLDGIALGAEDTSSPYSVSWNTTTATNGTHTLSALARDAAGNTTTKSVTVTVNNPDTAAPTVSLTAPASGATVSGTVTLIATAADNVGVAGVQFLLDGIALGAEDTSSPYSVSWNTTTATNGTHTLTARARDAAGNTTTKLDERHCQQPGHRRAHGQPHRSPPPCPAR